MTRIQQFHEEYEDIVGESWAEEYVGQPVRLFVTAYSGYDIFTEIGVLERGPRGGYSGKVQWLPGMTPGSGQVFWARVGDIVFTRKFGPGVWGNQTEHRVVGPWDDATAYENPPANRFLDVGYDAMIEMAEYVSYYYERR